MKRAMWRVDETGGFCFSDRDDPNQTRMLNKYDDDLLTRDLFSNFKGQTVKVSEIEKFVLTETPAYKL
jgi:hypothetical protein